MDSAVEALRRQLGVVHRALAAECSASQFARSVFLEDVTVSCVLAGCAPLALSTWDGRTGLSRLPPLGGCPGGRSWARCVEINVRDLRRYAQAVYSATDAYLSSLGVAPDHLGVGVLTALLRSQARAAGGRHPALDRLKDKPEHSAGDRA